jgi:DNA-binding NtrC family response regulator
VNPKAAHAPDVIAPDLRADAWQRYTATMLPAPRSLAQRVADFERDTIVTELRAHGYNMTETARDLQIERSHLYKKCRVLNIDLKAARKASKYRAPSAY